MGTKKFLPCDLGVLPTCYSLPLMGQHLNHHHCHFPQAGNFYFSFASPKLVSLRYEHFSLPQLFLATEIIKTRDCFIQNKCLPQLPKLMVLQQNPPTINVLAKLDEKA
jgi:hypothetical protein